MWLFFSSQIPLITYKPHGYIEVEADAPAIPTFADVMWVFDYEGESFARTRYTMNNDASEDQMLF